MFHQLTSAARLIKAGAWDEIRQSASMYWHSDAEAIGFRRDVTVPFSPPQPAIPISIRELQERDIPILFGSNGEQLSAGAMRRRAMGLRMVKAGLRTCYVAVTDDDCPCYVQWLIGSAENDRVRALFGDRFPVLGSDEMLLEGAFTLENWRGKGIMAAAMAQIAAKATDRGARWVITVVLTSNIPSIKGCKKAGFQPYLSRHDRWRCFKRRSTFLPAASPAD